MKTTILIIALLLVLIPTVAYAEDDFIEVHSIITEDTTYAVERLEGDFTATTFCPCRVCNGQWTGQNTASGAPLTVGRTIAVDPDVIPLGTEVLLLIDGEVLHRVAEDTGSAVRGNKIDLLLDTCAHEITYEDVEVWAVKTKIETENGYEEEIIPTVWKN